MRVRREIREGGSVEKVKLQVYIEKRVDSDLRTLIAEKYQTFEKGLLSYEVQKAIEARISTYKTTHETPIRPPNPIPKVHIIREQVKEYLRNEYHYYDIHEVPLKHVIEAIGQVRGTDTRTIRKWVTNFERYKILKFVTPQVVEFL